MDVVLVALSANATPVKLRVGFSWGGAKAAACTTRVRDALTHACLTCWVLPRDNHPACCVRSRTQAARAEGTHATLLNTATCNPVCVRKHLCQNLPEA